MPQDQYQIKDPHLKTTTSPTDHPQEVYGRSSIDINRLSQMRSYSYYFALAMCRTSEIAEALVAETNLQVWQHPIAESEARLFQAMQGFAPKTLGGGTGTNDYCILINGATDANFAITDVKWMSVTAGEAVPGDQGTSVAVEGSVKVSEPRGIIFIDQIVACTQALGVDASQVVWVLKPFFVGYQNNFNTKEDVVTFINDIKPIMFIPFDITAVYSELGGLYDIQFVGLSNGATRLPQYSRAADGFTAKVGPSLKDAMQQVANFVNKRYQDYYDCFTTRLKDLKGTQYEADASDYLPVKYIILLDPVYCNQQYFVTDTPQQFKDNGTCLEPVNIKQKIGGSIESAIRAIMNMSPQVQQDMVGLKDGKQTNKKMEYKVMSTMRSFDDRIEVIYTIKQFPSPKGGIIEELIGGSTETDRQYKADLIKKQVVLFDYIYTGLNTDILEYDLKVNIGLGYIQTAASSNSLKDQLEVALAKSTYIDPNVNLNKLTADAKTQPKIPLFFGAQAQRRGNNSNNPGTAVGAAYTLAKHANLEVAEATVKIRGNTAFLEAASSLTSPTCVFNFIDAKVENTNVRAADVCSAQINPQSTTQSGNQQMIMGDFPLIAKINVKMPDSQDDLQVFEDRDKQAYSRNFWFQGYYYIYGIEHDFSSDGTFTQTLQMIALPDPQTFSFLKEQQEKASAFAENVGNCFDGVDPCSQAAKDIRRQQREEQTAEDTKRREAAKKAEADRIAAQTAKEREEEQKLAASLKATSNGKEPTAEELQKAKDQTAADKLAASKRCNDENTSTSPQTNITQAPCGTKVAPPPETPPPVPPVPPQKPITPPAPAPAPQIDGTQAEKNLYAFRRAIAACEGTLVGGEVNYGKIVLPGTNCTSFDDHPALTGQVQTNPNFRIIGARPVPVVRVGPSTGTTAFVDTQNGSPNGSTNILASSAAGAYQFIKGTWQGLKNKLGLPDFSPTSQDIACNELFKQNRNSYQDIIDGKIITAVSKNSGTWASLPGANAAGQGHRSLQFFLSEYEKYGGQNIEKV